MEPVKVACCQLAPRVGDADGNQAAIDGAVRSAAAAGARIVVLPELVSCGYSFRDADEARMAATPVDGPLATRWHALTAELDLIIVGGFAELDGDTVYNSALLVDSNGVRARYRKVHLWDRERELFTPGSERPPVVDTKYGRLGVMICYDLEFPEWVRIAALAGVDLLCAPVNWPLFDRPEGERPNEIVKAQAAAGINRLTIAVCDRAGEDRGQTWLGGSAIIDPDGYPVVLSRLGVTGTITASVRPWLSRDKTIGPGNDVLGDRRPDLYATR